MRLDALDEIVRLVDAKLEANRAAAKPAVAAAGVSQAKAKRTA
jgi:hypothetical protein